MLGIAAVLVHDVAAATHRLKPFVAGLVPIPAFDARGCPLGDALKHIQYAVSMRTGEQALCTHCAACMQSVHSPGHLLEYRQKAESSDTYRQHWQACGHFDITSMQ